MFIYVYVCIDVQLHICIVCRHKRERNVLFNDALNTLNILQLYGKGPIAREETRCRHYICYSFRLAARVLLYAPSHRQDSTYYSLCYTSHVALDGTRNSSMGPPWMIDPTTHRTMSECSYHKATSRSGSTMNDQSDDPSHHEWMLLPQSYISLRVHHEASIRRPIVPRVNALTTKLHLAPCNNQPDDNTYVSFLHQLLSFGRIKSFCRFEKLALERFLIYLEWKQYLGRKEGNVLFNDALNTFYLRLYGDRHMVKDHSDSEKGNPLQPHRLLFPISSKGCFICTIQQTG